MPKRILAALCALLVAASTLAVVAQPAAAHSQTTTKQRCSYDPFAGNQCWTETVNVSHTHACGAGLTGTYPNCYPIPPANQNCGAGTTGTFPNCYPIPSDNTNGSGGGGDSGGDDSGGGDSGGDSGGDDSGGGDSGGDDSGGDDSGGGDSGGGDSGGDDSGGATPTPTPTSTPTPTPTPTSTPTPTADPCGDYADDLIDALNRPNTDGTYTLPGQPTGCGGSSTRELLGRLRVFGDAVADLFSDAFTTAMEYQAEAIENEGQMFDGTDELLEEIAKLWDDVPNPAKAAALGVSCLLLMPAEEAGSVTPASTALTTALVATCSAAVAAISDRISDFGSNSGNDEGSGDESGDGDDSTDADDESGNDDSDSNDDGDDPDSGDEPLRWRDVREARERFRQGYITEQEYLDVYYGLQCQNGNESACDE